MARKTPLAATYKHRITIQAPTGSPNVYGEEINSYAAYAIRSARIVHASQTEKFNGSMEVNEYTVIFKIRYDSMTKAINENFRISYNSNLYDIEAVIDPFEMHKEIHIYGKNRRT